MPSTRLKRRFRFNEQKLDDLSIYTRYSIHTHTCLNNTYHDKLVRAVFRKRKRKGKRRKDIIPFTQRLVSTYFVARVHFRSNRPKPYTSHWLFLNARRLSGLQIHYSKGSSREARARMKLLPSGATRVSSRGL